MHLGPKISGVGLAFPSAWRRGYYLIYNVWRTGAIKSKSPRTVLLIFAPQVYANLHLWRTPGMLLAYLWREFYTECTLIHGSSRMPCKNTLHCRFCPAKWQILKVRGGCSSRYPFTFRPWSQEDFTEATIMMSVQSWHFHGLHFRIVLVNLVLKRSENIHDFLTSSEVLRCSLSVCLSCS